jgi:hypothetical protein
MQDETQEMDDFQEFYCEMSRLKRRRDQLANPQIHLPLWMASPKWIMALAGSFQTQNQPIFTI